MSALTLVLQALAYDDVTASSNPTQLRISRRPRVTNTPVENPGTVPFPIAPGGVVTAVDGTRVLTVDGTTIFSIALSTIEPSRYRVTWTSGANPGFRTDRSLTLTGAVLTLTLLSNLSVSVVAGTGTPFATVQIGDVVFIPGPSTGDIVGPFNPLNEGVWSVLSVSGSGAGVTLARAAGTVFSGCSEVITPTTDLQLQAFAAAGVQVGDTVDITAGFASPSQHSYEIVGVSPHWIEFQSTAPLGNETGIAPGAAGLVVYTSAKRLVLIETDQEIAVRINGDTANHLKLQPWLAGDRAFVASFLTVGPVWKLVLVNLASVTANVLVSSAE